MASDPFAYSRGGTQPHAHTHKQSSALRDAEGGGTVGDPFAFGGGSSFGSGGGGMGANDGFGFMDSTNTGTHARTHTHMGGAVTGHMGGAVGSMSGPASTGGSSGSFPPVTSLGGPLSYDDDIQDTRTLLEELSIDFTHIGTKVASVLNPVKRIDDTIMADADMAGPIVFCLVLGFCLLLTGKMHFGYIYGFGAFGCIAMYTILNLMAESHTIDMSRTFSVLGYCLLPIVVLSVFAIALNLKGVFGAVLGLTAVIWCAQSSTRFFEAAMHLQSARYLIAYPALLFYACFALITIF